MPTLNATTGGSSTNSYLTRVAADDAASLLVSADRLNAWLSVSNTAREVYLMRATKMLDLYFTWSGLRATTTQVLGWPRYFARAFDSDYLYILSTVIPQKVLDATTLMAILLSEGVTPQDSTAAPLSNLKVGPIELTFDQGKSAKVASTIPTDVIDVLNNVGEFIGQVAGARMVPLIRA